MDIPDDAQQSDELRQQVKDELRDVVIDIIENKEFPPEENYNDFDYHITLKDFDVWKDKVIELIRQRLA